MKTEILSGSNTHNGSIGNLAACLPPIGSIVAVTYYSQLYTENSITGINAGLPAQWRVCDGTTISDADSPINGQTFPRLTDSRFMMGSTSSGAINGSHNSIDFTHIHPVTVAGALLHTHTHPVTVTGDMGHHGHSLGTSAWAWIGYRSDGAAFMFQDLGELGARVHSVYSSVSTRILTTAVSTASTQIQLGCATLSGFTNDQSMGTLSSAGTTNTSNEGTVYSSGNTGISTNLGSTDIRPSYFSCFYAMRIK